MGADNDSLVSRLAESSGGSAHDEAATGTRAARKGAPEHFIEFFNVSKSFGENRVLDDVSFFVERGHTVVIMGRSGVGKSVTLKHIMGFLEPDAGRIIVAGQRHHRLARRSNGRDSPPRHHGFSIRGAIRFAHCRRKYRLPARTSAASTEEKIDARVANLRKCWKSAMISIAFHLNSAPVRSALSPSRAHSRKIPKQFFTTSRQRWSIR